MIPDLNRIQEPTLIGFQKVWDKILFRPLLTLPRLLLMFSHTCHIVRLNGDTQSFKQHVHYTTLLENAGNNVDWLSKSVVQDVVPPAVNVVPPAADVVPPAVNVVPPAAKSVSTSVRHIISNSMYGKYLSALGLGIQCYHLVVFTENTSDLTALGIFNKSNTARSLNFPAPGRNI